MAVAKKAAKKAAAQTPRPSSVTSLTSLRPVRPARKDSRQELIDVAIEIIQNKGIDALRIEDVCERVGVSKGSLYWHFSDREGLIREALLEQLYRLGDEQLGVLSAAVDTAATRDEYLMRLAGAFVDPFDKGQVEARWQRLEMIATTRRDPKLAAIMEEIQQRHHRYLTDLMEKAAAKGFLRNDVDPAAIAALVTAIGLGSNILGLLGEDGPTPDAWQSSLLVLVDMLFPPA
ncbi:MAG: TetR/AcrR family transcriptional regulator [Ilumatobacteraceae bacterium]|nr:TetR/AcrR family transcriptional regulator [Ilumatobacteraceae bacterium]